MIQKKATGVIPVITSIATNHLVVGEAQAGVVAQPEVVAGVVAQPEVIAVAVRIQLILQQGNLGNVSNVIKLIISRTIVLRGILNSKMSLRKVMRQ